MIFIRVKFPNLVFKKADQGSEIVQDQGVSKINIGGKHLTLHAWLLFHEFVYEFCHFTSFSVFYTCCVFTNFCNFSKNQLVLNSFM